MTVKLKCPECHERVALWDQGRFVLARGTQRLKVRRGTRPDAVTRAQHSWSWQRLTACWQSEDGSYWTILMKSTGGVGSPERIPDDGFDRVMSDIVFECCALRFDVRNSIAAARRAEAREQPSTYCLSRSV